MRELKKKYEIAVLPGDGIGREVVPEAVKVLEAATREEKGLDIQIHQFDCGGEYYLQTRREWSEEAEDFVKERADAILLGGIGAKDSNGKSVCLPDGNLAGYSIVIGLRQALNLYANVRPIKLLDGVQSPLLGKGPNDINMIIVRENTEGLYIPARGRIDVDEEDMAVDLRVITATGSERVSRYAYNLAMKRAGAPLDGISRVTCVDKSNLLAGCKLFRESFDKVGLEFPSIQRDYAYVDAWAQWAIQKPEYYDVVVAPNEFGDIISDLGAAIQGGLGVSPSGNIGTNHAMFEPVHGSAPDIAGRKLANPVAAILSAAMMLDWLGGKFNDTRAESAARRIRSGVEDVLVSSDVRTPDLCLGRWSQVQPSTTEEVANEICRRLVR
ncbi:MAG: isocitrate/isopropylmalate dehydrogenase family protein [Candidatus Thorarchaeota archaeon]|nr:isocitrate/isopropylmalate dehydrogenase family protein [Candidatus Thorarchaeota archaeon]